MLHRLARLTVVTALAASLAGPWALLQSLAWASMLIDYSRQVPWADAVSMTFDGQHPCKMCRAIQAGKTSERQDPKASPHPGQELTLHLPPPSLSLVHPPVPAVPAEMTCLFTGRQEPPHPPPPRFV